MSASTSSLSSNNFSKRTPGAQPSFMNGNGTLLSGLGCLSSPIHHFSLRGSIQPLAPCHPLRPFGIAVNQPCRTMIHHQLPMEPFSLPTFLAPPDVAFRSHASPLGDACLLGISSRATPPEVRLQLPLSHLGWANRVLLSGLWRRDERRRAREGQRKAGCGVHAKGCTTVLLLIVGLGGLDVRQRPPAVRADARGRNSTR